MNPDWSKLTDPTRSELATMLMVVEFFDENVVTYEQCCGSGSARILNFCLDPDPELKFWIWIQQKVKEHINKTFNSGLFVLLDSSN